MQLDDFEFQRARKAGKEVGLEEGGNLDALAVTDKQSSEDVGHHLLASCAVG